MKNLYRTYNDPAFIDHCKQDPNFFKQNEAGIKQFMKATVAEEAYKDAQKLGKDFNAEQWVGSKVAEIQSGKLTPGSWQTAANTLAQEKGISLTDPNAFQQIGAHFSDLIGRAGKGDVGAMLQLGGYVFGFGAVCASLGSMMTGGPGMGNMMGLAAGALGIAGGTGVLTPLINTIMGMFGGSEPGGAPAPGQPGPNMPGKAPGAPAGAPSPAPGPQGAPGAPAPQNAPQGGGNQALEILKNPNAVPADVQRAGEQLMHDPTITQQLPPGDPQTAQLVQHYAQYNKDFASNLRLIKNGLSGLFGMGAYSPEQMVAEIQKRRPDITSAQAQWLVQVAPNVQI